MPQNYESPSFAYSLFAIPHSPFPIPLVMKHFAKNTRISIVAAEYFAYHGARKEEHLLGGRYQVDADIDFDASAAVVSDDLSDTINYEEILFRISEHMNGEPYDLIETLAFDMASSIAEQFNRINAVTIRVRKLNVPIQEIMDCVECEVTVRRKE